MGGVTALEEISERKIIEEYKVDSTWNVAVHWYVGSTPLGSFLLQ